jgi:hypothetical protein
LRLETRWHRRNAHPLLGVDASLTKPGLQPLHDGADDALLGTIELLEAGDDGCANAGLRRKLRLGDAAILAHSTAMQGQLNGIAQLCVGANVGRVLGELVVKSVEVHWKLRPTRNICLLASQSHLNVLLGRFLRLFGEGVDEHEQIAAMKEAKKAMLSDPNLPEVAPARELLERIGWKLRNVLYGLEYFHDLGALRSGPLGFDDVFVDRAPSGIGLKKFYPADHGTKLNSEGEQTHNEN